MKTKNRKTADPKKLKRLPRGAFLAKAGQTHASNTKVRISILIDLDVLNFFKERAAQPGSLPYQTQMNMTLRAEMEGAGARNADALARDDRFIQAVARRVTLLSSRKERKRA